LTVVKLLSAKHIATSPTDAITSLSQLAGQRTAHEQGDHCSRVCVPPSFSSLS
jgi:hypothetical protein